MATCRQAYRFICDNLDQELDSPRCRAIRRHLATCPDCTAYLDSLKKTVRLYRIIPAPRVPPAAHRVLVKALSDMQTRTRGRGKSGPTASGR